MARCTGKIVDCGEQYDCYDKIDDECYRKSGGVKPQPVPDNNKKKTTPIPAPVPKNVCNDEYGNTISNDKFGSEFKEVEGLKQFKNYLIKYYPSYVMNEGGVDQLKSATINDCMLIRLFYAGDPDKQSLAIGDIIYDDWKDHVGGWQNVTSKSVDEFDTWKKGGKTSDEGENTNFSAADWQTLIDNGQVSNKAIIRNFQGIDVLYMKYDKDGNRVTFDDLIDNNLDVKTMIKNINDGTNSYAIIKPPIKNDGSNPTFQTSDYSLRSKKYSLTVKYDANNNAYLEPSSSSKYTYFVKQKSKIDESRFKKFLLEKIKEKKEYKTIFVEDIRTPVPSGQPSDVDRDNDEDFETKPKVLDGSQNPEDDIFGLNLIKNKDARKIRYEEITPELQGYITGGSRSNYFAEWNEVGKGLGSIIRLKIPALKEINQQYHNKEIAGNNEILVGEPAGTNQYKKRYFYELFNLKGDTSVNTATIYMPQLQTTNQKIVIGKCDVKKCRTDLIEYLRLGFQNSYVPANEQERYDKMINICNCNAAGCFEGFKSRGKLAGASFEDKGYSREKLNVDQSATDKNVFSVDSGTNTVPKENLPRYNKTFNRNLTWNEIASYIRGDAFKVPGGRPGSFDSDLRIPNFGNPLGWCSTNLNLSSVPTTQKESFDERIDNKLLESIKNKNKKESIIENVLKNLLKDK